MDCSISLGHEVLQILDEHARVDDADPGYAWSSCCALARGWC